MHTPVSKLVDHLFRKEYGKLVAFLTSTLGVNALHFAEDIAQETLLEAFKNWQVKELPDNPSAWLFTVARNKAYNFLQREGKKSMIIERSGLYQNLIIPAKSILLENEIEDSVLRLFFACCSPQISFENQILLILNTLGGFSRKEIAQSLLLEEENVKKRLYRMKKSIRAQQIQFKVPVGAALYPRLNAVLNTLYLLFNQGYNSSHQDHLIRKDICLEAMRLCLIIIHHFPERAAAKALMALMCFHVARFDSRVDDQGAIVLLEEQDRSNWNQELIQTGIYYLSEASKSEEELSTYHLEANIAAAHCNASSFETTDWYQIDRLYHWLYLFKPSPIIQLNIAIVSSKVYGLSKAIEQLEYLKKNNSKLSKYYLLYATMGVFYQQNGQHNLAEEHFKKAATMTNSKVEKDLINKHLELSFA